MNTWTEGYINANNIRIHYHRTGGDKPALVLAHGMMDNGFVWSPLAQALEGDYDIIMVDARGHGLSDRPDSYSPNDHADDLAGVMQTLGLAQATVIGHSMGGESANILAASYPQLVTRLILEDPGWSPAEVGAPRDAAGELEFLHFIEGWLATNQVLPLPELTEVLRPIHPKWSDADLTLAAQARHQLAPQALHYVTAPCTLWWDAAQAVQCPTLVLAGEPEQGSHITYEQGTAIPTVNPRMQVGRINGAGHFVRRDQFDSYLAAVRRFLDK